MGGGEKKKVHQLKTNEPENLPAKGPPKKIHRPLWEKGKVKEQRHKKKKIKGKGRKRRNLKSTWPYWGVKL